MAKVAKIGYWIFQAKPAVLDLKEVLKAGALKTFAVKTHQENIKLGDKVILWQTGKDAGCYALAEVNSKVDHWPVDEEERHYLKIPPDTTPRVKLNIEYNLWNKPISKNLLPDTHTFQQFNAGLPGTNYRATKAQYDELVELVEQWDVVEEAEPEYHINNWLDPPLNLILYGPPGTGKTYQTINYALSVIENRTLEELALEQRQELRRRFNDYVGQGQIAFISFHQSYAYEDFVEGIKPVVQNGQVIYGIEDGIFKIMCQEARGCLFEAYFRDQPEPQQQLEFDQLYNAFLKYLKGDNFNYFQGRSDRRIFLHRILRFGNLSVRPASSFSVQTIQRSQLKKLYRQFGTVDQIQQPADLRFVLGDVSLGAYFAVFKELKSFEIALLQELEAARLADSGLEPTATFELPLLSKRVLAKCRKYVLIIDEINRGNIPAIFGELITLIEPDKREGKAEALAGILPYSKSFFVVPPNLYVIGTMNTADRSAEVLDLALRRRFEFRELKPEPEAITRVAEAPFTVGVDLELLLETINNRIALLLDEDYCIGHAYFLQVMTLDDLKQLFAGRILPLLQEYFFDDYAKIGLVLGKTFVRLKDQFSSSETFADFDFPYAGEFLDKRRYQLADIDQLTEADFIRIYDPDYKS